MTPGADFFGRISPNTPQSVSHNSTVSFFVTPDEGYTIDQTSGCGGNLRIGSNIYTTGPVTANCNVYVTFTEVAALVLNAATGVEQITLNWNGIGADRYVLHYSTDVNFTPENYGPYGVMLPDVTSPHTEADLIGTTYYFILEAHKDGLIIATSNKVSATPAQRPFTLPDTGQTTCYNTLGNVINCDGTGQDGEFSVNPLSYNDNGNGTVTDKVTGLIWQKTDDGAERNWQAAIDYCIDNTANLPGDGWRLPTRRELMHIVHYGRFEPAIYEVFSVNQFYWSASSHASKTDWAWYLVSRSGNIEDLPTNFSLAVRCVRD